MAPEPRGRAAWARVLILSLAMLGATGGHAVFATAGSIAISITAPTKDESFSSGPIVVAGAVTDPGAGITKADFAVRDHFSGLFLRADGTLGTREKFPLTLSSPGTSQSNWSGQITRVPGSEYEIVVFVWDSLGNTATAVTRFAVAPANAAGPGYLTIQWGRSIWSTADLTCKNVPGVLDLQQAADQLKAYGISATGTVVVDRTYETKRRCLGGDLYSSWADLAMLRDRYGWTFVSDGMTHHDITKMTPAAQNQESCGSLPYFSSHGHNRASGLFAYGDNRWNMTVQTNVVSTCFSYGRVYRGGRNYRASMAAPWIQGTNSILGGNCALVGAPCYTAISPSVHYKDPQEIANLYQVPGDEWVDVQFYQLVTGSSSLNQYWSWDCTNTDWHLHWTSLPELYCVNDFVWAMSQIPPGVVVTDPATVAAAWGRGVARASSPAL